MSKIDEVEEELEEQGHDESKIRAILESLKEDAETAGKTVEELLNDAGNMISELDLSAFSGVEKPAQDSDWFLMKSENGMKFRSTSPIYFRKEDEDEDEDYNEKQISYAEVLKPGEVDKQDDLIPSEVIENAAHDFLGEGKVQNIDINHDGITGKGKVVESYIVLEEHTPFEVETHNGKTKEIPKGTWISAVKWDDEIWPNVKNGDLQGFSIFGEGKGIELSKEEQLSEVVKELKELTKSLKESRLSRDKNIKEKNDKHNKDDNLSEEDEQEDKEEETAEVEEEQGEQSESEDTVEEKGPSNEDILSAIEEMKSEMAEVKELMTAAEDEDEEDEEDEEKEEAESKAAFTKHPVGDENSTNGSLDFEGAARRYEKERSED